LVRTSDMSRRCCSVFCAVLTGLAILPWRDRRDSYSCHVCRARKEVRTHSLLARTYRRRSVLTFAGDAKLIHSHVWFRYSHYWSNGLVGVLGRGVACNSRRYRDDDG